MGRMRRAAARADAPEQSTDVVDLAQDGRGIARVEGKVTFIRGALPGEQVRYRLYRHGKQADEGEVSAIERASPERVEPRCKHFGVCGGCSVQHLSASGQVAFKQKQLLDALERLGKVHPAQVAPAITGPAWGYRRRARLSVKHVAKKGGVLVGFREMDSPYVAQLESCHVLDPRVGLKLKEIAECVGRLHINTLVPQIEVAAAQTVTLVFRVMQAPTPADLDVLRAFGARHAFEIQLQTGGYDTIQPLDPPAKELALSPDGSDLKLAFLPTDFIQVNDAVNQQMVRQALSWLGLSGEPAAPALAPDGLAPKGRFDSAPRLGPYNVGMNDAAPLRLRQVARLGEIPETQWDALFPADYPFTRHAFLKALEDHGCVGPETGWEPCHLVLEDGAGTPAAAMPLYRKDHSYGEFVFDFGWARAAQQLRIPYYPKLVCA
ncbi:MAG: peptidogalycan biosysnthesis protein, partial [Nevskiaceae bacterium]